MAEQVINQGTIGTIYIDVCGNYLPFLERRGCGSTPDVCGLSQEVTTPISGKAVVYCRMTKPNGDRIVGMVCGATPSPQGIRKTE